MRTIIVGTRQSALALTQTGQVIEQLKRICADNGLAYEFAVRKIVTRGDRIVDVTLSKVGGKGLFVKEIEQAMLDGEIDIAVHSMKDMPSELPEGLVIGAVPLREDPRDVLISRDHVKFEDLPRGAKIGTSSLRRSSQLRAARPDLMIEWIRGNIDTRIRKLEEEGFDAIVLAAAGLKRMGWEARISDILPPEVCIPAVGQGALAIECRRDDADVRALLSLCNDEPTELAVTAERAFLRRLNGGCQIPIGGFAEIAGEEHGQPVVRMRGFVGTDDGSRMLRAERQGTDPVQVGLETAEQLIAQGADEILREVRG
jgi:hydroxymethylbilane synthase